MLQEMEILVRLRELENESKDERIAVLEREIAEDKHIHALKASMGDCLNAWLRNLIEGSGTLLLSISVVEGSLVRNPQRIQQDTWEK